MRLSRTSWGVVALLVALGAAGAIVWYSASAARTASELASQSAKQPHPAYSPGQACDTVGCHSQYEHAAPYEGACVGCHSTNRWSDVNFMHDYAPLDAGIHAVIGCSACHTADQPLPRKQCRDCHTPGHIALKQCERCHAPFGWISLLPPPPGHVSLDGRHGDLTCFECHNEVDAMPPPRCRDCHGVAHGGLADCERCHLTDGFQFVVFSHGSVYPLVGKHARVTCVACHPKKAYGSARAACGSCHGVKHGGLTACQRCHTPAGFVPSTFRHASVYPLVGRHAKVTCVKCHPQRRYGTATPRCSNCHGLAHGGLGNCQNCHTPRGFEFPTFNHSRVFVITGRHKRLTCAACHPGLRFAARRGATCVTCHGPHHDGRRNCMTCHSTAGFSFQKPTFRHPRVFPLVNAHEAHSCRSCHAALLFSQQRGATCSTCHRAPHVGPADCQRCHRPTLWSAVTFTHTPIRFHRDYPRLTTECRLCHPRGDFSRHTCALCHDFTQAP